MTPAGEIGHGDVAPQVNLGLIQDVPTAWPAASGIEPVQHTAESRPGASMARCRPRGGVQLAVENLGDKMRGHCKQVVVSCGAALPFKDCHVGEDSTRLAGERLWLASSPSSVCSSPSRRSAPPAPAPSRRTGRAGRGSPCAWSTSRRSWRTGSWCPRVARPGPRAGIGYPGHICREWPVLVHPCRRARQRTTYLALTL